MTVTNKIFLLPKKAQAATELAVFGAVLLFILGLIIRNAVNNNYSQSQYLKAFRVALSESFQKAEEGKSSHNFASVLFLEDRRDAESTKYGSTNRFTVSANGAAAFSKNLFMNRDWRNYDNLPVTEMFINGSQFSLWTAKYRVVGSDVPPYYGPPISFDRYHRYHPDWDDKCFPYPDTYGDMRWCNGRDDSQPDWCACIHVYAKIPSTDKNFCSPDPLKWSACCTTDTNDPDYAYKQLKSDNTCLTQDWRFDLNRDGTRDMPKSDVAVNERDNFAWQWKDIKGTIDDPGAPDKTSEIDLSAGKFTTLDVDGDLKEEQVMKVGFYKANTDALQSISGDNSPDEAEISGLFYGISKYPIVRYWVFDSQYGDLDLTYDSRDQRDYKAHTNNDPSDDHTYDIPYDRYPDAIFRQRLPRPGLTQESNIYTTTGAGTYLLIEEGKLYDDNDDNKQYIRDVQKRDRVDVVERTIQLSNDTGRLCGNGDVETGCTYDEDGNCITVHWDAADHEPNTALNPFIQVCNDCNNAANKDKNCFDETTKILWVRSRLTDTQGRKWITDVSSDVYPIKK